MKRILFLVLALTSVYSSMYAQKPLSDRGGSWTLLTDYSDEFNDTSLNTAKWDNNINDWGVWSWEQENVYLGNGKMHIRMTNEEHVRNGNTLYFKSGAARQKNEITYGYFEAKVKGCPKWPGVCPAFWMYSVNQPVTNGLKYNEVDFMEIQQRQYDIKKIDCNLHLERIVNGQVVRTDPPNEYLAPFNPNDGYHIYGCEVNPTTIKFYVDGVLVATNINDYWHLPMRITLSMGVRPPLMKYVNGAMTPISIINEPGFPTEMLVDYVRVWQKPGTNILSSTSTKSHISLEKVDVNISSSMEPVFPNPFSDSASIRYSIQKSGLVKLSVFNLSGKEVLVLVNDIKNAGNHEIHLRGDKLAEKGIYICKLQTDGKIYTQKIVLSE